jgi:hypothetical protein
MQFQIRRLGLERRPFRLCFLNPVFAKHPLSGRYHGPDLLRRLGLGNRNQSYRSSRPAGFGLRHGNGCLNLFEIFSRIHQALQFNVFPSDPVLAQLGELANAGGQSATHLGDCVASRATKAPNIAPGVAPRLTLAGFHGEGRDRIGQDFW